MPGKPHQLFDRIADATTPESLADRLAQGIAGAASPLYGAGAWVQRALFEVGAAERKRLSTVVLSVGNITLGGSGKSPFVEWLARWLAAEGRKPAILARGYGREDEEKLVLVHDGRRLRADARTGGDEPVMLGLALGDVPIAASADRWRAGKAVEKRFEVDTMVLDDGFQHHRLSREGDIVLLDASKPLEDLRVFPRGTLREPLLALRRAHLIVLTRCDQKAPTDRARKALRRIAPHVPTVCTRFAPAGYRFLASGREAPLEELRGKVAVLACGIAAPNAFRRTAKDAGLKVRRLVAMGDHAVPTERDLKRWDASRQRLKADLVVVTDKDAAKLRDLPALPEELAALRIKLEFLTEKDQKLAERAIRARLKHGRLRGLLR